MAFSEPVEQDARSQQAPVRDEPQGGKQFPVWPAQEIVRVRSRGEPLRAAAPWLPQRSGIRGLPGTGVAVKSVSPVSTMTRRRREPVSG
ncbi:MAG: hypothetical protein KatS3mg082_2795 [Nitrospiraceae bacterium]|nr:MAG: hypothetical protein KatS3mg082_2795 [Nitrospiraceae bacterium]